MAKEILRVATWNCAMALRNKLREVASLKADILVIQECAMRDVELLCSIGLQPVCWTGGNSNKGLVLASKPELNLKAHSAPGIEWAIVGTTTKKNRIGIVATWACAPKNSEDRYIRQIHKLLDNKILDTLPPISIVIGDFNSNTIWDAKHRDRSHSRAVEKFGDKGYRSAYHELASESQGQESAPTFFLYRNKERPYHIDYAFLSEKMLKNLRKVKIGKPEQWLEFSDHMPVSFEFLI